MTRTASRTRWSSPSAAPPAWGFVHSGHERSFVLDIADLYKTDVPVPAAFDAAAEGGDDMGARTRRALRDRINRTGLLDRCVKDIKRLLRYDGRRDTADAEDRVTVQSDDGVHLAAGRNHAGDDLGGLTDHGDEVIW